MFISTTFCINVLFHYVQCWLNARVDCVLLTFCSIVITSAVRKATGGNYTSICFCNYYPLVCCIPCLLFCNHVLACVVSPKFPVIVCIYHIYLNTGHSCVGSMPFQLQILTPYVKYNFGGRNLMAVPTSSTWIKNLGVINHLLATLFNERPLFL